MEYTVNLYLPSSEKWYDYFIKFDEGDKDFIIRNFDISEFGLYVKGGSILPIKLHNNGLSLLRIIHYPIRLEIYLDALETA
jgi:alpha-glucosidase (family GH31 glycosyl hydrolase)